MTIAQTPPSDTDRRDARWRLVSAEHGIASLRHTHWLDDEAHRYDGAPGSWAVASGRAVGRGLRADAPEARVDEVALAPGESVDVGRLRLKAIDRDGAVALRVFDPENPGRTRLRGIRSFPQDPVWIFTARFRPAGAGETRVVRSVDGYEREEIAVGTVGFEIGDLPVELTVSRTPTGLSAVVADGTSNVDAYRFRFVPIDLPDTDGAVTVDFNRAYLPPCAFSDQYVCPLPPAGNRLGVRIEAGERVTELAG